MLFAYRQRLLRCYIGYKTVIIEIEGFSVLIARFTPWNINLGKPIYNIHIRYDLVLLRDSTRSTALRICLY